MDGFHPINVGRMALGQPAYIAATPFGILKLLEKYQIETSGKHCVVIGRSNIVGTPMSILLSRNAKPGNCTVTLCHSRSKDLAGEVKQADIVIAAVGKPKMITADMIKAGAAVIDVGINRGTDGKLVGDVDFEAVSQIASWITPVPGGVGPMTIALLLTNTLSAAQAQVKARRARE